MRFNSSIKTTSASQIAVGVKAQAYPALGVVGQVFGVVEPPRSVVVPEVVIRVAADADGNL